MGRPLRIEYPDAHYHVTSRGNERKDVFKSQKDREQFLSYLESAVNRYNAVIHVYCLMSNHILCGALHKMCYVKRQLM
jgi:REP element-mobilizing transposase RayT